ncbi:MAG: hypothetical protein EBZ36_01500 [Acidobacteria bacterium]|nr:hypothetical protein [Acidobacteriota bacterium]
MVKTWKSLIVLVAGALLLAGAFAACRRGGSATRADSGPSATVVDSGSETIPNAENDATVKIEAPDKDGYDLAYREEIRRKYTLKPQSTFRVFGINGPVRVESVDGDVAELLIVRSARSKNDLQYNRIVVSHEDDRLRVYREDDHKSFFSAFKKMPEGRQRVVVRLPRRIDFIGRGVNGGIDLEQIEGSLDVSGVNGYLRVAGQTGPVEVRGQNGEIDITMNSYTGSPIEMSGINGEITLRFVGKVNATVVGRGNNGEVTSDLPDFKPHEEEERHGRFEARIGTGGAEMEFHGINGNIRLLRAGAPSAGPGR